MSSLWTPGGEHRVDRQNPAADEAPEPSGGEQPPDDLEAQGETHRLEATQAEMEAVRAQLASVPATQVVANHAMGLFELGAIHLSQEPPNLAEAVLAIDAMATLVEGLGERLGDAAPTLAAALAQIRMAFVQVRSTNATAG